VGRKKLYSTFVTISLDVRTRDLFLESVRSARLLPGEEDLTNLVRAALLEWLQIRAACDLPLPRLLKSLSRTGRPVASQLQATRDVIVRVGITDDEAEQLHTAACSLGWGRMTPNMVITSALAEWTDIRAATTKAVDEVVTRLG
jgi:hypothetical protein